MTEILKKKSKKIEVHSKVSDTGQRDYLKMKPMVTIIINACASNPNLHSHDKLQLKKALSTIRPRSLKIGQDFLDMLYIDRYLCIMPKQ